MRVSTSNLFQTGIQRINDLQSSQAKLQQQISTGRRILTPSDDPNGSARAINVRQAQAINENYINNRQIAVRTMNITEGALGSISNLLTEVKSKVIDAGNGSYTDKERAYIANDLQGRLDQLIGLANSSDGAGNFIFAGFKTQTQPFVATATGATYQGDTNQRTVQISETRQIEVSDTGDQVFQANGTDVFSTIKNLINLLNTPIATTGSTAYTTQLNTANAGIDQAIDNILLSRAKIGSRLNEIESLDNYGQELKVEYARSLSEVEDLDYAKAISDVSQQQVILQAAQKTFAQTAGLSLFEYI